MSPIPLPVISESHKFTSASNRTYLPSMVLGVLSCVVTFVGSLHVQLDDHCGAWSLSQLSMRVKIPPRLLGDCFSPITSPEQGRPPQLRYFCVSNLLHPEMRLNRFRGNLVSLLFTRNITLLFTRCHATRWHYNSSSSALQGVLIVIR